MIFYVLDNLNIKDNDNVFIIYYNLENYEFKNIIKKNIH